MLGRLHQVGFSHNALFLCGVQHAGFVVSPLGDAGFNKVLVLLGVDSLLFLFNLLAAFSVLRGFRTADRRLFGHSV